MAKCKCKPVTVPSVPQFEVLAERVISTVLCAGRNLDDDKCKRLVEAIRKLILGAVLEEELTKCGVGELVQATEVLLATFFEADHGVLDLKPGVLDRIQHPESLLLVRRVREAIGAVKRAVHSPEYGARW